MLAAVEPSGDALGAALFRELKKSAPEGTEYVGCGGPLMEAEGFVSQFPIDPLSVMGFTDVARVLPLGLRRARELVDMAIEREVDAVVFIDGWAFSRIAAARFKRRGAAAKLFKLAAPQLWASRPQRIEFVKTHFDGVLCLLPFETPLFEAGGVPAAFVGNPNFQAAWAARGDGDAFRARRNLGGVPLLAVFPGSRRTEVRRHLEPFGGAVAHLAQRLPSLNIVTALPASLESLARPVMEHWAAPVHFVATDEKADAMAAADVALVKSGTVTTEVAINRTPFVVAYKVDRLTAFWARRVRTAEFATILNIAAGREVVPECLQEECTAEQLAADLLALFTDEEARLEQLEAFPGLLSYLDVDGPPAAERAAAQLLEWLGWANGSR